jgi:3-deoxy-D-manno-octulosonic-acid transferase
LRPRFANLALVIAPRHLERIDELEKMLQADSLRYVRASSLGSGSSNGANILLLDTMGDLRALYRRAAVAFVGGSLVKGRGGQNPAEAAMASVPVLMGPHHENQREVMRSLVDSGGALVVRNASDLANECTRWLADDASRREAGHSAHRAIANRSGGARIAVEQIQTLIDLG